MRPAVAALARHHRVITFSLCDERSSPFPCQLDRAFDNYVSQVELALERAGVARAVIVGVSYGGLIAAEFAARHPDRVGAVVLASALHASWEPDAQQRRYLAAPILRSPLFAATAPRRLRPEVVAALPGLAARVRFTVSNGARAMMAPPSPARMARRIAWAKSHRFSDTHVVKAPALVVTGEPGLDRVVPVDITRRYLNDFDGAEHVVLKQTGHIGVITRPDAFAGVIERFVSGCRRAA
jgi:3-oxoadipate enol-lactonase